MKSNIRKTTFILLILQVLYLIFSIIVICQNRPATEKDIFVEEVEVSSIYWERAFTSRADHLIINCKSGTYRVPEISSGSSVTEVYTLIATGDVINIKYITRTSLLGNRQNWLVEIQDEHGNLLRTLKDYNRESSNSVKWIVFFIVLIEIVFIACCVMYVMYCKYILGLGFKRKKR